MELPERASVNRLEEPEPTVVVDGDLDFAVAAELKAAAASLLDQRPSVTIDLSSVRFIDSSGLGALVDTHKLASGTGKSFEVRGARDHVRRALQVSGFGAIFGLEPIHIEESGPYPASESILRRADWDMTESVVVGRPVLVASLRETAAQAAREAGLSEGQVGDVKLAVGEALTNSMKHAVQPGRDKIRLRCMSCSSAIVVEVTDQGRGFDPDSVSVPDPHALQAGGLGIHLMRSVMDEVEFTVNDRGSKVRMLKWIDRPEDWSRD